MCNFSTPLTGSTSATSRRSMHRGSRSGWGGELGFARFDGTRFVPVLSASGNPFTGVSGIVARTNGDLWLNAIAGLRMSRRRRSSE